MNGLPLALRCMNRGVISECPEIYKGRCGAKHISRNRWHIEQNIEFALLRDICSLLLILTSIYIINSRQQMLTMGNMIKENSR